MGAVADERRFADIHFRDEEWLERWEGKWGRMGFWDMLDEGFRGFK